jgi:hypothetical protein
MMTGLVHRGGGGELSPLAATPDKLRPCLNAQHSSELRAIRMTGQTIYTDWMSILETYSELRDSVACA